MIKLSALRNSTLEECARWRETSRFAPFLLAVSVLGFLLLNYFFTINSLAITAGAIAGISASLGHLGVAILDQRVQAISLLLLLASVLVFPPTSKSLAGLAMLNGFVAGTGSFSIVFLLVSLYLRLGNE
jgi:hypothetical protein